MTFLIFSSSPLINKFTDSIFLYFSSHSLFSNSNLFSPFKAIKFFDNKRFITISWKTTYEWGGHYIISLYSYDENYTINLIESDETLTKLLEDKVIENVLAKFNEGIDNKNDEENNLNIVSRIRNLIEEKNKDDDYNQNEAKYKIEFKNKNTELSFTKNIFEKKDENGDTMFRWYSNFDIDSFSVMSENLILIQSGYSNLEILEVKPPAPNSV